MTAEQLRFAWPQATSSSAGDFFVSEANRLAHDAVLQPELWPRGKLALIGPKGAGKSHLARIWADRHRARSLTEVTEAALSRLVPTVVDGADDLPQSAWEPLFHLHNALQDRAPLLLVARKPPAAWGIGLRDLATRMEATMVVEIAPPDDALLTALILKLFADRQLSPDPHVARYLAQRTTRSYQAAAQAVAALDELALRLGREVNRSLAADWLSGRLPPSPEGSVT